MERGIVVRHLRQSQGLTLGLTVVAVLGGCTADSGDEGILILKNVRADDTCKVSSSETELFTSGGTLETATGSEYIFIAQAKSRITALAGQEDQRLIQMQEAKVDLSFPDTTRFTAAELADLRTRGITHFKQLLAAPLAPNGGLTDVGFVLLPPGVVAELAPKANAATLQIVATFTIDGDMSGATVGSQPFTYPITLGKGVVAHVLGKCSLPAGTTVRTGYACNPYQDGAVDCCSDASGMAVCPGTVATM